MGKFKFNGISSEDFGLVIQTPPTYVYPERDLTNNHVPGRSGDIVIDNKCYKNVERTYQIAKGFTKGSTYYSNFQPILDWLNSANGSYARLEDSYDSDVYRLGSFQIGGSFVNYFDQAGATEVRFNCKPQRYLRVGENDINYSGATLSIENPSRCPALPEITVKNIDTGTSGVLMMSVLDKDGNATSSISFTEYVGDITLNSEDQTVYNSDDEDMYSIISLNGKNFPSFAAGVTSIEFAKYEIESSGVQPISAYSSLLIANQLRCLSEYKTYAAIESGSQEKILIKSYDHIIDSYKEPYSADSVQTMISDKSVSYKFESFNTLLSRYAKIFQFTGTLAENTSEKPDWLTFDQNGITIKAAITGFFMVGIQDKRIRFLKVGENVINSADSNAINSIYYYKASKTYNEIELTEVTYISSVYYEKIEENYVLSTGVFDNLKTYYTKTLCPATSSNPPHENNDNFCWLEIEYTDKPSWISYAIVYDSDGSPTKINYVRSANGYYWTDKTWIFGKAQWTYYTGTSYETFASLSWNTSKKAFVANEGLSLSTTMTFTYKYLNGDPTPPTPTTLPAYDPVVEEVVNKDTGEATENTLNAIHFAVKDTGINLAVVSIYSKEAGYYSIKTETSTTAWTPYEADSLILNTVKGTEGFEVFYLEEIPDYSEQAGWPTWLDPIPVKTGDNPLEPTTLQFKVKKQAFYRVSSGSADETGGTLAWGTIKSIDDLIPVSPMTKTSEDYYYVYMVEEIPVVYERNRCYTHTIDGSLVTTETPPAWLSVELNVINEVGTNTPTTIKYKVGAAGYYKWDSNSVWVKKATADIGGILFESSGKDESNIYYLASLPTPTLDATFNSLILLTVKETSTGNPSEVEYKVLETGYYRFNNNTDWEYILAGTVLFDSKINESNMIYHLKELSDSLAELEIVIKPRWWML